MSYGRDEIIRAKGALDGAVSLAEAAEKARKLAGELQELHDKGYVLRGEIYDDYGFYFKGKDDGYRTSV